MNRNSAPHTPYARWISLFAGALAAITLAAPACTTDEGSGGSAPVPLTPQQRTCGAIGDFIEQCGAATPCDDALLADCDGVVSMLSEPFLNAVIDCIEGGQPPTTCLPSALEGLQPTDAQRAFASQFCEQCTPGVPGCADQFFSSQSGDAGIAGKLILPLGDGLVDQLKSECASKFGCVATFAECAKGVLAKQAIPEATLQCLLTSLKDPPPTAGVSGCGMGGANSSSSTSAASSSSSSSSSGASSSSAVSSSSSSSSSSGGGSMNSCCSANLTPGCIDPVIEQCVCAQDSYCCTQSWDANCVAEVDQFGCGTCQTCTQQDTEPNDTALAAETLGSMTDCNNTAVTANGTFVSGSNSDWFMVHATDSPGCVVDPKMELQVLSYFCGYYACDKGTTKVTCPPTASKASFKSGGIDYVGCCVNGQTLVPQVDCTGTLNDSVTILAKVSGNVQGDVCWDYSLAIQY